MTEPCVASTSFLQHAASKHFVSMTYRADLPDVGAQNQLHFASCFRVELKGYWWLVTAGHVINGLNAAIDQGARVRDFNLHDKLAGNSFDFSVPIDYESDSWVVVEGLPDGADYAACPLISLYRRCLEVGGIQAIAEQAWGPPPFDQYDHWLLAGIPKESLEVVEGKNVLKLTLMPASPCEPPINTTFLPSPNKVYGRLITQPELDGVSIRDIDGMSGCPVFGVNIHDGKVTYWLIGVQSSWYRDSRTVAFAFVGLVVALAF